MKIELLKHFWKTFSWQIQFRQWKSSTIFGFEVISVWIKGVQKKLQKKPNWFTNKLLEGFWCYRLTNWRKINLFKRFWKIFSWKIQCRLRKSSTMFRLKVISIWIKEVPQKSWNKLLFSKISFYNFLIQTFIASKWKIVEDFRRRHWICHEKIFQKLFQYFFSLIF